MVKRTAWFNATIARDNSGNFFAIVLIKLPCCIVATYSILVYVC